MSQRRIPWIEQNVEKVVLGVVGAVLVGVVALQALHQPNKVKVGTGPDLAPEKAFDPAGDAAKTLRGRIGTTEPAAAPKGTRDISKTLDERLALSGAKPAALTALGPAVKVDAITNLGPIGNDQYAAVAVPAPTSVIGGVHAGTIHPLERVWHEELGAVLPAQQPFDKMGVSVEGVFNAVALYEALLNDPDGDGPLQPLPRGMWLDQMNDEILVDIVQVELERETIRPAPGSTEAVGTKAIVPAMPGRFDGRKAWSTGDQSPGQLRDKIALLRANAEQVQRPPYYALIAGQQWDEPKAMRERYAGAEDQVLINRLKTELTAAREQLRVAKAALDALPIPGDQPRAGERRPPEAPAPRGRPGPGGGGRQAPKGKQPTAKDTDPLTQRQNAQGEVTRRQSQVTRLERRLSGMGVTVTPDATATPEGQPAQAEEAAPMWENAELQLWAHDMTAAPGAAYRYRMRVVINNPLFGQRLNAQQQQELAKEPLILGEFSEWSEPVEVDALREFFITSASEATPPTTPVPTSNAAMFVFWGGGWREASVRVTPGDVFAVEVKLPEFPIYDLADLAAKFPAAQGIPGADGAPPAPGPVNPRGPGPGRMAPPPGGNPPAAPGANPGQAPGNNGVAVIPGVASTPGPKNLAAGVASVFLDAQRLIVPGTDLTGQQRAVVAAILRDPSGQIVARSPENDKASASYKRLQAMVRAQAAAKAPVNVPQPNDPVAPRPGDNRPPPPPPGGGGGGGGG